MKGYLKSYNLILCLGWAAMLIWYLAHDLQFNDTTMLFLNIFQGLAILEIFHALLKWVSSPVVTTVIQVSSRIFVLVLINLLNPDEYIHIAGVNGLHLIMLAWSITEIIRYGFYFTGLIGKESKLLLTLRYTTFIFLYPMGVTGELLIVFSWMNRDGLKWDIQDIVFAAITLLYVVFFPKMYLHMWSQRKKKLN